MSADAVISKYAQALLDSAPAGSAAVMAFEVDTVSKIFGADSSTQFFKSPFNTLDNKLTVAKASLEGKCMPEVFNFIITLVENDRIGLINEINHEFQKLHKASTGETEGTLFVVSEPTEAFKKQVEGQLSQSLNKKVSLKVKVDPSLIAGYKVEIGGWTIDDSAAAHIKKLKETVTLK